jgi:hypothetical protein
VTDERPWEPDEAADVSELIDASEPEWTISGVDPDTGEVFTAPLDPTALLWAASPATSGSG